jgi:hypothetical protein
MSRAIAAALVLLLPALATAQATYQTTRPPTVAADNEPWYVAGEGIIFAGNWSYPAGAQVFFNRYEMVRSGFYRGIPLYTRTTIEPFSLVFVPLSGGLMQPYERRRSGELAGTTGSSAPSFPGVNPNQASASADTTSFPQAAGPPTGVATGMMGTAVLPDSGAPLPRAAEAPAPTSGTAAAPVGGRMRSAAKPEGLNGVFVTFDGRRWFSSGPAIERDAARLVRVGEYRGFPVYADRDKPRGTIYLAVAAGADALVAPYALRR